MIQGETDIITPALFHVVIKICLGNMMSKTTVSAIYLLLVEILPEPFELVPTGLKWQTGFGAQSYAFMDSGEPSQRD